MKKYKFDNYTITLHNTRERELKFGKFRVAYQFIAPDGEVIFEGRDLFASPLHEPESLEIAKHLLSFLTYSDDDWTKKYTPRQLEFVNSMDCELLQIYTTDD